jgi:diguanylate cyclase (GGDEF)-like protein
MLVGVGLATAITAGGVGWYVTQNVRSQQLVQSASGAARLGISLVRQETAAVSSGFACEVGAMAQTADALRAGGTPLTAAAAADTVAAPNQILFFASSRNSLLAMSGPNSGAAAQLLPAVLSSPSLCSSDRDGFFVSGGGVVYGAGVAQVVSSSQVLGKVVVLTPVSAATLSYAAELVGATGPKATTVLENGGRAESSALVNGVHVDQGRPLPAQLLAVLDRHPMAGTASLGGSQVTIVAQSLQTAGGATVATLVVVQSALSIGPTVAQVAIPLALAVAAVLLIGMLLVFFLAERFLNGPLRRLNQAVQRLGQDAYAKPVHIDGAEEVTRLSANFEIMRRQLKRQLVMAAGRTVIASTLNGPAPVEQALNQVLQSLIHLVEAEVALIVLRSPQTGTNFLITTGIGEPALEWSEIDGSDGIVGQLVRDAKFVTRYVLQPSERGALERRIGLRDCLAEPLRTEGQDLGVLIVGNKRSPYLEEDIILCNAVAEQVVAAVEKSMRLAATQREATTDAMTGLYNYRFLISYLDQQVNVAERAKSTLSVLMLDLDHFKVVNDSFGHPVGDRVLRAFADMVLDTIRKSDLAARYGGEEFVVVMANTNRDEAQLVAEKIRLAAEGMKIRLENDGEVGMAVSVGGVTFPEGTKGARNLLDLADRALYAAKRAGRNRVEFLDLAVAAERVEQPEQR